MTEPIKQWSLSRYETYEQCPRKAMYLYVEKRKEPESDAMKRGQDIHKLAERFLKHQIVEVPAELSAPKTKLRALMFRDQGMFAEAEIAFDRNWNPTGWFDKDCWLRVKLDILGSPVVDASVPTAFIGDWKTGKEDTTGKNDPRLTLYALTGFLVFDMAQRVQTELVFVDADATKGEVFERKDMELIRADWMQKTRRMLSDTEFKPAPSYLCRYCHFRSSNGGPCTEG